MGRVHLCGRVCVRGSAFRKLSSQRPIGDLDVISIAAIAQLGERQTEDLKIPGSIPGLGIFVKPSKLHPQAPKSPLRAGTSIAHIPTEAARGSSDADANANSGDPNNNIYIYINTYA
jgi:hypothetical protein